MTHSIQTAQITPEAAQALVRLALTYAADQGWQVAVAVSDPHGFLVAFGRSAEVAPPIGEFAIDKAHTAAMLRKSTKAFGERMASSPTLSLGLSSRARLTTWGGGVPVFEERVCIGGIGVSGAQDHEDIACARAALAELGLDTR